MLVRYFIHEAEPDNGVKQHVWDWQVLEIRIGDIVLSNPALIRHMTDTYYDAIEDKCTEEMGVYDEDYEQA